MNWLSRLKIKWGIKSNIQFIIIMIVFAITGSLSLILSKPILLILGISPSIGKWLYYPLRLMVLFPIYQICLLLIGTLLGQFYFFWKLEKKMFQRIGLMKLFEKNNASN